MTAQDPISQRPDSILLVIAYLFTIGVAFLVGAIFMLLTALPIQLQMARSDSLFLTGVAILLVMLVAGLLAGGWLLLVAIRLWRARPSSRASAALTSAVLAIMALLSIPTFFMAYGGGPFLTATVAAALLIAITSAASYRYLTRPHIRAHLT